MRNAFPLLTLSIAIAFSITPMSAGDLVIRDVHSTGTIDSLADVDALLAGTGIESETTSIMEFVNLRDVDAGSNVGHFSDDFAFPNNETGVDDNDFATHVTGQVFIPAAGDWTFGVNSDDGSRLRIGGSDVIVDDSLHAAQDRFGTINLAQGWHSVDFVFFERGGTAAVEFFAAAGNFSSFAGNGFSLVGDTASGGLQTVAVPEPTALAVIGLLSLTFLTRKRRKSPVR